MRHESRLVALVLVTASVLAACQAAPGGTAPASSTTASPAPVTQTPASEAPVSQAPASFAPTTQSPTTPAPAPTIEPGQTLLSIPSGALSGGGAVLPEGNWSGGAIHLVVSGDFSGTYDAPLVGTTSLTTPDITLLNYLATDPDIGVAVSINPTFTAVVVTTPQFVGGGGSTQDAGCTATFPRADASGLEGTLSCQNAPVLGMTGGGVEKHVNIEASFTATR